MDHRFSIEDLGQPNPRQAEVDRLLDAAARSLKARTAHAAPPSDDVSLIRPDRYDRGDAGAGPVASQP